MLVYKAITSIFSTIIGLFQLVLFSSTASVTANLRAASANAKTYEEWLLCQEELDALSGRNIWSATFPSSSSSSSSSSYAWLTAVQACY
jgi:hypothetical protein